MPADRPEISVNGWNAEFIESMYERWLRNPAEVGPEWQRFFEGFDLGARALPRLEDGEWTTPAPATSRLPTADGRAPAPREPEVVEEREAIARGINVAHTKQGKVDSLIYHYRDIGHLAAQLDPLGIQRPFPEFLTLESFGLSDSDLDEEFDPGHLPLDNPAKLRDIVELLEDTYCRNIGAEYMHIQDREQRRWLQKRMETMRNAPPMEPAHKLRILERLMCADSLERFLDTRYKGKKWFSLSGAESLIPMLDEFVELAPLNGVEEYTMGMAHRGRVNVLVNILNKSYEELFTEFHEAWEEDYVEGGGDVKYHRGYSTDRTTEGGHQVHLTMASNPSHLEFVNAVVLGRCRAKQRLRQNEEQRDRVVPILIHGDASFPAQGIVAECFNLMKLDGYTVGGSLHIVVNNQIGFTTDAADARSGQYCTDIAKMVNAPIFHVNGDDPEACAHVARLALEFRQAFKCDVVIDLWCYRVYGHNESDEPAFTQPLMYERISKQTPIFDLYAERLQREGIITPEETEGRRTKLRERLDHAQTRSKEQPVDPTPTPFSRRWEGLTATYSDAAVETGVARETLAKIATALGSTPADFTPHRKLKKLLELRGGSIDNDSNLDWAMGELLAYGSLLLEGHAVRLTGQDVERGTFSHRHATLFDSKTGRAHVPLNHIARNAEPDAASGRAGGNFRGQAKFCIHNSPLSEQSCVGYEYGYSLADPAMLIIWEAQFGDFANGAQVIIDQFIASAEIKWQRHSGLVLLLPHAYEGQGPEHSSARLERFLQLCADNNMQVIYPTTPAQIFHALRRQLKRNFRKPLIVMTPKSLLRHKGAVSSVDDFTSGSFQRVIDDASIRNPRKVTRLILCSGKIYYDLIAERENSGRTDDIAIVRVEQLYPFPMPEMEDLLDRYEDAEEILWVQEEPMNAGAYRFIEPILREELDTEVSYIGRDASATPAVGSSKIHAEEQAEILAQAMAPFEEPDLTEDAAAEDATADVEADEVAEAPAEVNEKQKKKKSGKGEAVAARK